MAAGEKETRRRIDRGEEEVGVAQAAEEGEAGEQEEGRERLEEEEETLRFGVFWMLLSLCDSML